VVAARRDVAVRVLGPFEVRCGGEVLRLAARPSLLLATLAVWLAAPVSYGRLAELLWPGRNQPADSRRAIQTYASRLRDVLGRGALLSDRDGLRLELEREQVDLHRFRDLAAAGEVSSPVEELDLLTEALALWRGEPLEGSALDMLRQAEGPALVEELLAATERASELRLELNRIDEVFLATLSRLTSEHPWRERLWGQLMLGLHRTGRQGEALATYQRLVTTLREDLGVDPGPEVVRLHQHLLAGGPPVRPEPPSATAPAPAQLPAGSPTFIGRRHELAALERVLGRKSARARLAIVTGPAGVGKTTTAVEAAHLNRASFPDGQLFIHGATGGAAVPPRDILGAFLRALGTSVDDMPQPLSERAALFRSFCAERRLLILLDDAHSAAQVTALLPGAGACAVIVTSRRRLSVPANLHLDLGAFRPDESSQLLTAIVGSKRLAAEPSATASIIDLCAGSPLALRIVAGRLAVRPGWPVGHLSGRLADAGRLAGLSLDGQSVGAAVDATVGSLEPDQAAHFRQLSVVPLDSVDVEAAAALWEVDRVEATRRLEEFSDIRLVEPGEPEFYSWHGLIGHYLRAHPAAESTTARRRMLQRALRSLANASEVQRPDDRARHPVVTAISKSGSTRFANRGEVHDWLHPRLTLFIALARDGLAAADESHRVEAAALTVSLDNVLTECCQAYELTEDLLRTVTTVSLPTTGSYFAAAAWHNLAALLSDQGRLPAAHTAARRAIAAWRQLGDRYCEVAMLNNLAVLHNREGDHQGAIELFGECLDAADVLPPSLRARCIVSLAGAHAHLGQVDEAKSLLEAANALSPALPTSVGAHVRLTVEILILRKTGRIDDAMAAAREALALAQEVDSRRLTARAAVTLAQVQRQAGLDSSATAAHAVQVVLQHRDRDIQAHAEALAELGHAHYNAHRKHQHEACVAEVSRLVTTAGLGDSPWAQTLLMELTSISTEVG
jgi:DNA-binding SARP family transcriptional activator/tetratricopeptide (TPR) repeat protein